MSANATRDRSPITRERATGAIQVGPRRQLGFACFGPAGGANIVWLHGTPGAATQVPEDARARAEREGFRIIGIDRPGVGESTEHVYRDASAFADDLTVVLDTLGVDVCSVVGLSGGGPYSLAAAARITDRIDQVAILGGVAPTIGPDAAEGGAVAMARFVAPVLHLGRLPIGFGLAKFVKIASPIGDPAIRLYARFSPDADRELLTRPDFKAVFVGDLTSRGNRQFSAAFSDLIMFTKHWGFSLDEVARPVHWWHGTDDNIVPFEHGRHVTSRLPDATFNPIAGGGHLCGFGVSEQVLDRLLAGN